jgi:uncharacterized damage-inducible protein DinB
MANEAWLNGKLDGFAPIVMPAGHALVQAIVDLEKFAAPLKVEQLIARPNETPSVAFHLRHIAGSIDRLLTYARGEQLNKPQFDFLKTENAQIENSNAAELTAKAVAAINHALETLKSTPQEILFEERSVGRRKLPTNVFGLLFHVAEHTARHVGQIVTISKIVAINKNN